MKSVVDVFLLGFSSFEKSTFESFFMLSMRRDTHYKLVSQPAQARVIVVNSDNVSAADWANSSVRLPQKALFIGKPDATSKWPSIPRPIELASVLALLDVLVLAGKPSKEIIAPKPQADIAQTKLIADAPPFGISARVLASVRRGTGKRNFSDFGASDFLGLGRPAVPEHTGQTLDRILIVDDDDSALKFMQKRMTRYGFQAELAKTSKEALVRISRTSYKFVFLEVMLRGMDGYQVCREIKQSEYADGKAPVVVMLSSRGASADKLRGGLAGCDSYLTKPLKEDELLKVLSKYDEQVQRSFRPTNLGLSGLSTQG